MKMSVQEDVEKIIPDAYSITAEARNYFGSASRCQLGLGVAAAVLVVTVIALGVVVTNKSDTQNAVGIDVCYDRSCMGASAYTLYAMNRSVDPCEDFYTYACGKWKIFHPIKPTATEETPFIEVYRGNEKRIRNLIEINPDPTKPNSFATKSRSLFMSCLNDYQSAKNGGNALLAMMSKAEVGWWGVGDLSDRWDLSRAAGEVHINFWTDVFFKFRVGPDYENTGNYVLQIDLGGLGMGWWYYILDSTQHHVVAYKKFIRTVGELLIRDAPKANITPPANADERLETFISDVWDLEFKLANITQYTLPSQDPHAEDNRVSLSDLTTSASMINWKVFFSYMFPNVGDSYKVVLLEKEYVYKVSDMVNNLGVNKTRILNNYMVWRLAQHFSQDLSWDYVHANREFYVARTGRAEFLGAWNYCFNLLNIEMPEALGALFVQDHFVDDAKVQAHKIVEFLKKAVRDRINSLDWMEDESKKAALKKLEHTSDKLGYPDWLGDTSKVDDFFEKFEVKDNKDFFQNLLNLYKFKSGEIRDLLNNGEDRSVWLLNVYDTHGTFYQYWNELLFPAGMLQFPFFSSSMPSWMNYGAIGTRMGHELVHAFDEYGGYFTETGTIHDWWTPNTTNNYLAKRECVVDAYNVTVGPYYIPGMVPPKQSVRINSRRYAYEGIAEIGGVKLAYNAYLKRAQEQGKELRPPGLNRTVEQSFFISYAQTNCFNRLDTASYYYVKQGGVPENVVVNGALSQMQEFSDAFQCKAASKMNAPKKCNIF